MKRIIAITFVIVFFASVIGVWILGGFLSSPMQQNVGEVPGDLVGRSVEFPSNSGALIRGWFVPGARGQGTIVLMHGVRATRASMLERARFLSRAGYSVLLFDFQAHGESSGDQIAFGHLEREDAQASIEFARRERPDEMIGVVGVSMGGAAAVLASPPLKVDAMVLEMVYPSIEQAIANRLKIGLGGWAGLLTPLLSYQFRPRLGVGVDALRPVDRVKEVSAPKLFIAGGEDKHTTIEESRELYLSATGTKELWIVAGAEHIDLHRFARDDYENRILDFFALHIRGSG